MLTGGIYLAPSQFETAFISAAQTEEDLVKAIKMTEWSFKKLLKSENLLTLAWSHDTKLVYIVM